MTTYMHLTREQLEAKLAEAGADVRMYRKTAQDNIASRNAAEFREKALRDTASRIRARSEGRACKRCRLTARELRAALAAGKKP